MILQLKNFTYTQTTIKRIISIVFILFTANVSSQSSNDEFYFTKVLRTTRNFFEIEEKVEQFYADKDKGKGSGYTQWKRWQHFYKKRLMPDGTIPNLGAIEMKELQKTQLIKKKSQFSSKSQTVRNWTNIGLDSYVRFGAGYNGGIGRVNCIVVDPDNPNIIYVGTPAGGLWRSTTGGNSWKPLTDKLPSLGISGIAIDYNSPVTNRTIYILTGDGDGRHTYSTGVMKSTDNGLTWIKTGLSFAVRDFKVGYKLLMDKVDSNILMAAMDGGIYRTTDGGVTWTKVLTEFRMYDIESKPRSTTVYASGNGVFYKSTNRGETWKRIRNGLPVGSGRTAIAVTSKRASYVYLLFSNIPGNGQFGGLYRSSDSGNTFSLRSNRPNILGYDRFGGDNRSQSNYDLAMAVSPTDAEEVHVGGINCWKSNNGGETWENTSYWREDIVSAIEYTHADIHALEYIGETLFVGSDGGIYKTKNKAKNWESISNGLNISQPYKIGLDPTNAERFVFGSQDNGSNKYENGTYFHWFGADGFESIIDPTNPQRIYGSFQFGGLNRTEDGGLTVTRITPKDEKGNVLRGIWSTPYTLDSEDTNTLYGGYGGNLYKSTNKGDSWVNITPNNDIGVGACEHIAVAPSDNDYIYLIKRNSIHYSHDQGKTWNDTFFSSAVSLSYITVHTENPKVVWLTSGNFAENEKVFKSIDGGKTFTNISGALPNIPINCIVYQKGTDDGLYVGTDIGVFYRDNTLSDWQLYSDNFPNTIVTELEIQYLSNKIYAATFGRGVWIADLYSKGMEIMDDENCINSITASWKNTGIQNQTTTFETKFTVRPSAGTIDGVVGLSNTTVNSYNDMGVIIRFNKNGNLDARNGGNYLFSNTIVYRSGSDYSFRVRTDLAMKKYSVYVTENNGEEQLLAKDFNFRTQQAALSNINNWATFSSLGSLKVCDFEVVNDNKLPSVVMTSPANNSTFEAGSTITLSSNAIDSDGSIVRVTWFRNGIRIRSDSGSPYSKPWENVPEGIYEITAIAEDDKGAKVTSEPVSIRVVKSICKTSENLWSGVPISSQNESFEAEFTVTPNQNNMDGVVGLSSGIADSYAKLAAILRLNKNGEFDARNGGRYEQSNRLQYSKNMKYEVRFEVNMINKKYSVFIKPPNTSTEVIVADNFDFRTDQAQVNILDHWSWISGLGSHEVCLETIDNSALVLENSNAAESLNFKENNVVIPNDYTLDIFPNPASGKVSLLFVNGAHKEINISIYDSFGKKVKDFNKKINQTKIRVDISLLKNGIYFVTASNKSTLLTKKLVVFN